MKEEIKKPLNLLILLGFICQGFAWENLLMPILFVMVWFLVLRFKSEKQVISDNIELLVFFLSLVLSLRFIGHNAYSRLLAMGNALMILQTMRLLSPLNRRKQLIAMIIAVTHLAVGSQFILDYSFIIVLFFSIILIPKVLFCVESASYTETRRLPFFANQKLIYFVICIIMVLFFLIFPRRKLVSGKEAGMIMSEGPMRARMDTVTGGGALSNRSILRIKGDDIKYLKCFALDTFDGDVWTATSASRVMDRFFNTANLKQDKYRYVTVMDLTLVGSTLPVDGQVQYLKGNFFQDAHISAQGSVVISLIWPQSSNYYEYWTTDKSKQLLTKREIAKYISIPAQSPKLQKWLNDLVKNEKDPELQLKIIQKYLRENFTYELGTPDLDRFAPIDDFILNQKSGHCERFASALALFARMLKIPSRVVIGYYLPEKNQFADYYNVQISNGHAWIEVYLPQKGWTIFDGTPYSDNSQQVSGPGFMMTIKDWLDYVWYSKIVEFSPNDQNMLLSYTAAFIKRSVTVIMKNLTIVILILTVAITFYFLGKLRFKFRKKALSEEEKHAIQLEAAEKFYADMLESLARKKIYRRINQTPYEFADASRKFTQEFQEDIRLITDSFCLVKYGEEQLSLKELQDTTAAVEKIKERCRKSG